jgi:hypothetical protein
VEEERIRKQRGEERMRQERRKLTLPSTPILEKYTQPRAPPLPITNILLDIPEREHEEVSSLRPPPRPHRKPPTILPGSSSALDEPQALPYSQRIIVRHE